MDLKFPFNQDVENAQEKILQAKSAQEIKDLLKQDDPKQPNYYQEGLIRLVSLHIMKQFPPEEIDRIENISHHNVNAKYGEPPFSQERTNEIVKLASKMDNEITSSILVAASQKHDPFMIPKELRDFTEPEKDVGLSVAYAADDHIKKYPNAVEKIFEDVLPKIQQDKQISDKYNWTDVKELNLMDKDFNGVFLKTDLGYFVVQKTKDTGFFEPNKPDEAYLSIYKDKSDIDNYTPPVYTKVVNNVDTAKMRVERTFDYINNNKDLNINDVKKHLDSFIIQEKFVYNMSSPQQNENLKEIEIARKAGYVQGVCECVAAIGDDHTLGKKLLTEMNVTKDMVRKFANPETFKTLEQGIFAPKQEQTLEQTQGFKR